MKTAILIDSTAYLCPELMQHPDVFQVSLSVAFADGTTVMDLMSEEAKAEFYQKLDQVEELPVTSQPVLADYYRVLDQMIERGYDHVIGIFLSSGISGTYQTARMIMDEYRNRIKGYCIDSRAASVLMEDLARQGLKLVEAGLPFETIIEKLEWVKSNARIFLMVEDLDNLVKGGRLSATSALVGGMLKIRPLLYFDQEGKIVVFEKIRTNKKVYARWKEIVDEEQAKYPYGILVAFAHSQDQEEIERVRDQVLFHYPGQVSYISQFGPVVGTHVGLRCKGMGTIPQASLVD